MSGAGAAIFKVGTFCLHFLAQSTKSPLFPINVGQLRKRKRVLCWSIYIIVYALNILQKKFWLLLPRVYILHRQLEPPIFMQDNEEVCFEKYST